MKRGTFRGKGASKTRVVGEGGQRKRIVTSTAVGGSLAQQLGLSEASRPKGTQNQQLRDELLDEQRRMEFDSSEDKLRTGEKIYERKVADIDFLLNDLNNTTRVTLAKRNFEVEVRLLHGNDSNNFERFLRTLKFLQSNYATVHPVDFQEKTYTVKNFEAGYTAAFIWRGEANRYVKIKKTDMLSISLPSIINVNPRLGISIESDTFAFDTNEVPSSREFRRRWSFPIDMLSAGRLNTDIGISVLGQTFHSLAVTRSLNPELLQQLTNTKGSVDLTISRTESGTTNYSIEIEIDPSTININVQKASLTELQYELLDTWTKILITVINKTGVFMTSIEKEYVERGFNKCIGEPARRISRFIVNQPEDLQRHDLSWLSPEKSDMFMQLANYDKTDASNLRLLRTYDIQKPLMSIPGGYSVSLKADGTRFFLFLFENGLYLINPLSGVVTRIAGVKTQSPFLKNIVTNTILDTEVIGTFSPMGTLTKYQFLVFDILAHQGTDVRNLGYRERQAFMKDVVDKLNNTTIIQNSIQENQNHMMSDTSHQLEIPAVMLSFDDLINIQLKPIYKLPALDDIPEDMTDETEILLYRQALAKDFFERLGFMAKESIKSTGSRETVIVDDQEVKTTFQNTGGILWRTDGIIATPTERPYLERGDSLGVINNALAQYFYSLVRKWKFILTIDFRVARNESMKLSLFSYEGSSGKQVEFVGQTYPWNGNAVLNDSMEGKIIEFEWAYSEEFLDYAFVPYKERPDKPEPNSFRAASNVWKLINDPITIDELYGEGPALKLMRRYHNRVKRSLLVELTEKVKKDQEGKNPRDRKAPILLDLGSGNGGDRGGWGRFDAVYAIEPDVKNLREFISRQQSRPRVDYEGLGDLKSVNTGLNINKSVHYSKVRSFHARSVLPDVSKPKNRFGEQDKPSITIVNSKAEDIVTLAKHVPVGKVTCVTLFNALTFFYENVHKLQSLIDSVKTFLVEGGYFYVIAFDGELLLNSMRHKSDQSSNNLNTVDSNNDEELPTYNTIKSRNITITKAADPSCRKIWIKIESTIVRGQFEYLINTREFTKIMELNGFKLIDERYLDEETLLTQEEYWFSSMFKVMKFKFFLNPNKKELGIYLNQLSKQMESDQAVVPLEPTQPPLYITSSQLANLGFVRLVRFGSPQDGSCYIHSILRAYSKHYKSLTLAERTIFMIQLRAELANKYTPEIHNSTGDGFFASSQVVAFKYDNVKASIARLSHWVDNYLMEFVGDALETNVYILRGADASVYRFGDTGAHVKAGRKNVILYWINDNHYEMVGIYESEKTVRTVFTDAHPLIQALHKLATQ